MVNLQANTAAYHRAAQALHGADAAIKREFTRALRDVAKPYGQFVLAAGAKRLPRRGGLDYRVAGGRVSVAASTMRATVSLRTKEGYDLTAMDQGQLRHPVFARKGKPRRWAEQRIAPGAFSEAFEASADTIRPALVAAGERALQTVAAAGS